MIPRAPVQRHHLVVLVVVVVLVVAVVPSCSGDDAEPSAGQQASTGTVADDAELALEPFADVPQPIALAPHPGTGALFVAGRDGLVHVVDPDTGQVDPTPALDISDETTTSGERGLLGIAIDPRGRDLYLSYTNSSGDSRVDAYELDRNSVLADTRREVLALDQPYANHNGGEIVFGPDGYLYLGFGDGGSGGDPRGHGQDTSTLLGSILRIDPAGGDPYAVPEDNPFVGGGGEPEIWLFGVRNPWRFSFDRDNGDLWVGDVGQDQLEEIDHLPNIAAEGGAGRGANLGWGAMEGTSPYSGGVEPDGHVPPVYEYANDDENCAVTGGYVYRGERIPELWGLYVFGDYCAGRLRYLRIDDSGALVEQGDLGLSVPNGSLVSFGQDLNGELYVLSIAEGVVYRIEVESS